LRHNREGRRSNPKSPLNQIPNDDAFNLGEKPMTWKAPKIVEVPVGMEINMYACAARK
jgi:coenzyme PQQ precursor peptide PqqA